MTIRLENLTIAADDAAWTLDMVRRGLAVDVTNDETYALDMLSAVRHIMRERNDCTMIPVVRGLIRFNETNEYGHNGEIEVSYSRTKEYRAIYGVHFGERLTKVECYMD